MKAARLLLVFCYIALISGCESFTERNLKAQSLMVSSHYDGNGFVIFRVKNIGRIPVEIPNKELSESIIEYKFKSKNGELLGPFKPVIALVQRHGRTLLQPSQVYERSINIMRAFQGLKKVAVIKQVELHWNATLNFYISERKYSNELIGIVGLYSG